MRKDSYTTTEIRELLEVVEKDNLSTDAGVMAIEILKLLSEGKSSKEVGEAIQLLSTEGRYNEWTEKFIDNLSELMERLFKEIEDSLETLRIITYDYAEERVITIERGDFPGLYVQSDLDGMRNDSIFSCFTLIVLGNRVSQETQLIQALRERIMKGSWCILVIDNSWINSFSKALESVNHTLITDVEINEDSELIGRFSKAISTRTTSILDTSNGSINTLPKIVSAYRVISK